MQVLLEMGVDEDRQKLAEWISNSQGGTSDTDLADQLGISRNQLYLLKRAKSGTTQETLESMIRVFGVTDRKKIAGLYQIANLALPERYSDPAYRRSENAEIPAELQRIHAFQCKIIETLPPGPARDNYIKQLEANAEMTWAMIEERLKDEGD